MLFIDNNITHFETEVRDIRKVANEIKDRVRNMYFINSKNYFTFLKEDSYII